jgi:hypothetical protein
LFVVEEVAFVTGYTIDVRLEGVAVDDLILFEDGPGLLLGLEIVALDVTAWRTTLLGRVSDLTRDCCPRRAFP